MPQRDTASLVLDARTRPGLVAVRELGKAGIVAHAVDSDPRAPAFASRWAVTSTVVPDFGIDADAYVDALLRLCAEHRPRSMIPSHDGSIEALRNRRSELERVVGLALATEEALAVAVDKRQTLAFAAELGMRVPRGAIVHTDEEAAAAVAEVGLPAVIKPLRSWVQAPAGVADDPGQRLIARIATALPEALGATRSMLEVGAGAVIQEWLPGDREALSFFYAHGRIWARFAQRADRTSPPLGGNSVMRESIPLPQDIAAQAERLVVELGIEGYSEVEFRRDRNGGAALMEINPRLSASVEMATRAGVSFPRLLHAWAAGEPLEAVEGYRTGLRMRWLGGDLEWLDHALKRPGEPDVPSRATAARIFIGACARPSGYDYLDRRDPRPALRAVAGAASDYGARARRRARSVFNHSRGLDTEVAVIGAGPYGLSVSAHLAARGVSHEIFGEPMDAWRNQMPAGMHLKSEGFASNLADPGGEHTLERFCAERGIDWAPIGVPIRLSTFADYGSWFQQRLVPAVNTSSVELVRAVSPGFQLWLGSGETLRARRVVIATGMQSFAYTPPELRSLPAEQLLHSSAVTDPAAFAGQAVVVLGRGQSALESATLLEEHGARVTLVARTGHIDWAHKPRGRDRKLRWRIADPLSGLGEGLRLLAYADHPLAFHSLPRSARLRLAYTALAPCGSWWLQERFERSVEPLLGRAIADVEADDGGVRLDLRADNGLEQQLEASCVVAATGFRPDLGALGFIDPQVRDRVASAGGAPLLDRGFQSSVSGLHFVGYAAAAAFGPVMRFVFGTDFAARRLAADVAPYYARSFRRRAAMPTARLPRRAT
jgi:thioredoxin reductase/predicted ATP-grasp superfamily ATP-dependent carboligase